MYTWIDHCKLYSKTLRELEERERERKKKLSKYGVMQKIDRKMMLHRKKIDMKVYEKTGLIYIMLHKVFKFRLSEKCEHYCANCLETMWILELKKKNNV